MLVVLAYLAYNIRLITLPNKDPNDFTLTSNSIEWETEQFCPNCKASTDTDERFAGVCNNCGKIHTKPFWSPYRSYRKIIKGSKWVYQYKFEGDKTEIVEKKYP